MPNRLGDLIPKKLAKHGLTRPVLAAQVVSAWAEIVQKVFPKGAGACQVMNISKTNVVSVRCTHATIASELALRRDEILEEYRRLFPKLNIAIRFQTGDLVGPEVHKPSK